MKHAPKRFTDARHFAAVLASLNEQIDGGGARGIDYERAAEPKTCAPVRPMGSPVEDLIAERAKLAQVLYGVCHARDVKVVRKVEREAWKLHRLHGVSYGLIAKGVDKPARSVKRWVARTDEAVEAVLGRRGMLARGGGLQAEPDLHYSSAWDADARDRAVPDPEGEREAELDAVDVAGRM